MALIRSLNTAVSGIQAQQFRIEVIGNNIANVDTTAFKSGRVDFATMMSQLLSPGVAPQGSLGGIDPTQIGHGVVVGNTVADHGQGPIEATGVQSDLALQGDGFFIVNDEGGGRLFTRDGSFTINPSGYLHDPATGYIVQGWVADENFEVSPGGPLQNIEIPIGTEMVARATSIASIAGNLDASGRIGDQGTRQFSDRLYDNRFTNNDLISAENPLGLARATADTPLANLVRSLGDFVRYDASSPGVPGTAALVFPELANQPSGVAIDLSALKGERTLPGGSFVVGDPPPTGGTTLGDFIGFLQRNLGINSGTWNGAQQTQHTVSFARTDPQTGEEVNGTLSLGVAGGPDDSATLTSLTDHQANFRSVRTGDIVRFTSGAAAGQFAEVVGISSSIPGGPLDTLTFRSDGFNSLEVVPAIGDTYTVHAPAGVRIGSDIGLLAIDGGSPTVTVGVPTTNGGIRSFTVTDSAVADFSFDHGLAVDQRIEYLSGGTTVTGWISDISGGTLTISYDAALSQDPDVGTTFTAFDAADGSIEIAGNIGTDNDLSSIELVSAGRRISLFDQPPVVRATGESVVLNSTVFDSLGNPRQVQLTFVYEASAANGPNVWRYFAESPDDADLDRIVGSGTVLFRSDGQFLTTGEPNETITIDLTTTPEQAGGVETPFTYDLDLSWLTQFASTRSEIHLRSQDGFEAGTLNDYAIGTDGLITGIFSNGETRSLGQIATARFANPNGLTEEPNNFYSVAPNSGAPQIGVAGTFGRGSVGQGFLEESNVDLAQQFTDLVIAQRAFQANARTVSVADEMLQELVNLI